MRIIVTGGSGFIGTNLIEKLLIAGNEVFSLDIVPAKIGEYQKNTRILDICDRSGLVSLFLEYRPEYVIHLAARTDLDEKTDIGGYATNVEGVSNIVEAVKQCGTVKRCIYTSTQLVCRIGYVPKNNEDYCPNTLYGESKMRGEKIVKDSDGGGVEWCIARPTTVWGPWMKPYQERFVELVKKGHYFHIGSADRFKSYGYVGNFCHQLTALLSARTESVNRQTFYLADYAPLSLKKWADAFQREFGARAIPVFPEWSAVAAAKVGDFLETIGFKGFPLTSFRLKNINTEYIYNLDSIRQIAPELPYAMDTAVFETVSWFNSRKQ